MRKQAKDELDAHVAAGDLVSASRSLLKEHWRQGNGKPVAPGQELEAEAVGNLRDALDYMERGDHALAAHHAWRFQCALAKLGKLSGIENVPEQGVWQCIEMCRGAADTRDAAVREKDQAVRERDEAHGKRLQAEARHALMLSERDAAKAELVAARAELGRLSARAGNTAAEEAR